MLELCGVDAMSITGDDVDFAHGPLDMARIPIDAVALLAYREFVVCRVYEWRYAARDRVTRNLLKYLVAAGASCEGEAARIEWIVLHHLANLITEKMAFDIEDVWRSAQPLIASQQRAPLLACQAKDLRARERRIANHVSAHQPQPSCKSDEHSVG